MKRYDKERSKEVFWDMSLAETVSGISLKMHEPVRKGTVLLCDRAWEGEDCNYAKIFFDGEKYCFYYRGSGRKNGLGSERSHGVWCVAYSYDGKTFERPDLELFEFGGNKSNNIIMQIPDCNIDNFSITFDENPACPHEERYKAFTGEWTPTVKRLHYYISADGIHFNEVAPIKAAGHFDSLNVCFWDKEHQRYCLYLRGLHDADPEHKIPYEAEGHVRDVRVSYSKDIEEWTEPLPLDFGKDDLDEIQMYTNGMMKYPDTDMYIGIPTRYIDRALDGHNFKYLPTLCGQRKNAFVEGNTRREGTAITEAMLMTSRDGLHFERTKEAFYTPGIERDNNWNYGGGYFAVGMAQTKSDFEGEPDEISLYVVEPPRNRATAFERYTLRNDGFFSWRADFGGGEAITKPFTFEGDELHLNFSTSALGYLRIEILDEDGKAIEGYDSHRLFGNSTDRPCDFEKPLSALRGIPVRLRISMRDADLYSLRFV
ncbi:MAG: hypothetical protein E7642_00985 [Ruminococcaceae bacterium]|nr:hypothetical protein [Oscillospiraceae bacterium]